MGTHKGSRHHGMIPPDDIVRLERVHIVVVIDRVMFLFHSASIDPEDL